MWMLYAIGSSFFAGITAILAKCGIKKTDSDVGTAIRTIVVLVFSWLMVLITGTGGQITVRRFCFWCYRDLLPGLPGCVIFTHCKREMSIKWCRLINRVRC